MNHDNFQPLQLGRLEFPNEAAFNFLFDQQHGLWRNAGQVTDCARDHQAKQEWLRVAENAAWYFSRLEVARNEYLTLKAQHEAIVSDFEERLEAMRAASDKHCENSQIAEQRFLRLRDYLSGLCGRDLRTAKSFRTALLEIMKQG